MSRWGAALCAAAAIVAVAAAGALAAPVVRTPGYAGVTKAVPTKAPGAPPSASLGAGTRPDLIVDTAGTAHIVWTIAPSGEPTRTMYCRVPRAARSCEVLHALVPPGADQYSVDLAGPAITAVNDQVVVMSARYPQTVTRPDGTTASNVVWMWTSDDGGQSFTTPAMVSSGNGPGTAVAGDIRGGAVTFGPAEAPAVAVSTGVVTGGVTVTTIRAGTYTPLGASVAVGDYVDSRLAVLDGRPVVVYRDLSGNGFLRRWTGLGDPNDAATWAGQEALPGRNPQVTVAGGRLLVAVTESLSGGPLRVHDLTRGGAPALINPGGGTGDHAIAGLPDGRAVVTWRGSDRSGTTGTWMRVVGADGRPQANPVLIGGDSLFPRMAAAGDGGGVVAAEGRDGTIVLSAFGPRTPTGAPGLGGRPGGGALPADASVGCQRIRFGAVETLIQDGCYLNAATGRAKVSTGPVTLNGLVIVPDPGVQVIVDARARTINTSGTVRVLLRARGVPEILLFRGSLRLRLAGAAAGRELLSFPRGVFNPNILGFPVAGDVDVTLTDRGVRVPLSLRLPAVFRGITGSTVLVADNMRGLHLESIEFRADGVPLGAATMRRLHVQYKAQGGTSVGECLRPPTSGARAEPDEWAGVFELQLPPPVTGPALCGSVRFGQGAFRAATFNIDLPPPGIVLFPGISLTSLGGGLQLSPATRIDATARIAVIQAAAGGGLVNLDGRLAATFGSPFVLSGTAATSTAGVTLGTGGFTVATDGYVALNLASGPRIGPVAVRTRISGFADAPRRAFGLSGRGEICVGPACATGAGAVVSSTGLAVCLPVPSVPRGAGYRWGRPILGGVDVWLTSCDMDEYETADARANALASHQAAGEAVATVRGRPASAALRIRGAGGPPAVDVIAPGGAVVAPEADFADAESGTLFLSLRRPVPGLYTVRARAGSPPIAEVAVSQQVTPAAITRARVAGAGRRPRALHYRARIGAGQGITLLERGRAGTRVIGTARPGSRTLRFAPGPGPGGRREIVAVSSIDGLARSERVVARFIAPPPPPVARASRLVLRRAGSRAVATWRPGRGLAAQRVTVRVSDGRSFMRTLNPGARRLAVVRLERRDRVTVTVTGQARDGRLGRAATARLRIR
jgi:hypothetical protein